MAYVTQRLLFFIPTLLIVLSLSFYLSTKVPGDSVDSYLQSQGIRNENTNYRKLYQNAYQQLGYDKPLFYWSIVPNFYPENIEKVIDPSRKRIYKRLLEQMRHHTHIDQYFESMELAIKDTVANSLVKDNIQKLLFAEEIYEIEKSIKGISTIISEVGISNHALQQLVIAGNQMTTNKVGFYLPTIKWHGVDNRFHQYIKMVIHLDFGNSIKDGIPVIKKVGKAIRWTAILLLINIVLSFGISLYFGLYSGYYSNSIWDKSLTILWLILYSIPVFWLATLLIMYCTDNGLGQGFALFPTPGIWLIDDQRSFLLELWAQKSKLILPIICLVSNDIAYVSRFVRNHTIDQKLLLYVQVAKAKGLSPARIIWKHILPNISIPLITLLAGSVPAALAGSLIIEVVFNIPGMGRLMHDSIYSADWSVVFAILLLGSLVTMFSMLIGDIITKYLNPKWKI